MDDFLDTLHACMMAMGAGVCAVGIFLIFLALCVTYRIIITISAIVIVTVALILTLLK
jgi:hypothetical protein